MAFDDKQMEFQFVEGKNGLVRDKISKAIVSTDSTARQKYLSRKKELLSKDQRIESLEKRVLELEAQIKLLIYRIDSASIIV